MPKSRARIGYGNFVDEGSVSAGSQVASLPASNVQDPDINRIWRAASGTASHLVADFGAVRSISFVTVINTNAANAQVRLSVGDSTGSSGDAYNSGLLPGAIDNRYRRFVHSFAAKSGRYLRVDLSGASSTVEAGRLAAGPTWEPRYDIAVGGYAVQWRDHSRKSISLAGVPYVDRKPRQQGVRLTSPGITLSEAQEHVDEINRLMGTSQDILFMFDPGGANPGRDAIWGMQEPPATYRNVAPNVYSVELEVWARI